MHPISKCAHKGRGADVERRRLRHVGAAEHSGQTERVGKDARPRWELLLRLVQRLLLLRPRLRELQSARLPHTEPGRGLEAGGGVVRAEPVAEARRV